MSDPAPTRRTALSYLTTAGVAIGALIAGGALARSCTPRMGRVSVFDLSDMQDGEARGYSFSTFGQIIVRDGDTLVAFDAQCPVAPHYVLMPPSGGLIWCHHCTSRFRFDGQITQYWSNQNPPDTAPNLNPGRIAFDGLTIAIAEDQSTPTMTWSSL